MAKNLQTVARRALTPCAASDAFRFADGGAARDLAELRHMVSLKSGLLVLHHRDAYAPWVEGVLGDPALARKVERVARAFARPSHAGPEVFRAQLVGALDERIGKLRDRVL